MKQRKQRIRIEHDDIGGEGPREWDNLAKMVYLHRIYILGDNEKTLGFNALEEATELRETLHQNGGDDLFWDELSALLIRKHDACVILPMYMLDHSGLTISTTPFACPWDSMQVGFIYTTHKDVQENWPTWKRISPTRRKKLYEYMVDEVKTYDQFLTGNVYGWILEKLVCERCDTWEQEDSCWGYYGSDWRTNGIKDYIQSYLTPGVLLYGLDGEVLAGEETT